MDEESRIRTEAINNSISVETKEKSFPQGLKPHIPSCFFSTAKAVPSPLTLIGM